MPFPNPFTSSSSPNPTTSSRWADYLYHTWAIGLSLNAVCYTLLNVLHLMPNFYQQILSQGITTSLGAASCAVAILTVQSFQGNRNEQPVLIGAFGILAGLQVLLLGYHMGLFGLMYGRGLLF